MQTRSTYVIMASRISRPRTRWRNFMRSVARSITPAPVDHIQQRLASPVTREVPSEKLNHIVDLAIRPGGRVLRQDRARTVPQRIVRRQRLALGDVEHGAAKSMLAHCRDQRRFVHQRAATDVDEER